MSAVLAYFRYFDLRTIIDILLVAFVIYKVLMLIRGTRAVQLLKGLAVLVLASALSDRLGLETTSWILDKAWTALFVALPVVFQPELRRALEQLGRAEFYRRHYLTAEEEAREAAGQVARACSALSQRKVGALMVLTRETGLKEYVESGIRMDSLISAEALINIFEPNTPLHDGAVIINGNRIQAAACYLPLSQEWESLSKEFGTRHRAALGITEQSDAVAVVVSEETGLISLVYNGKIARGLSPQTLEERLVQLTTSGNREVAGGA